MQIIEKCFMGLSICLFLTTISYAQTKYERVTFAGGCFWCMTPPFEKLNGMISVVSGYTGGEAENPSYEDYAEKGHLEAVEIIYDPTKITYQELLDVFWRQIDPTDSGAILRQGPAIPLSDILSKPGAKTSGREIKRGAW